MKKQIIQFSKFCKVAPVVCLIAFGGWVVLEATAPRIYAAEEAAREAAPPLKQTAPSERAPEDRLLEGAWDIVINSTPNPPFAVPFRILRTVSAIGVSDAYAFPSITPSRPGTIPFSNTSGHGDWGVLDHGLYTCTVKYFQLNTASLNVLDSIGTVRENIRMAPDGNSYTSVFETTITLPDGTTIVNKGTTVATRIKIEPLLYLP